jgi:hypothetical protein
MERERERERKNLKFKLIQISIYLITLPKHNRKKHFTLRSNLY